MRRPESAERAERRTPEMWHRRLSGPRSGKTRHRPVERREAQGPTSLGSRPGQGLANLARPARRYRKARHGVRNARIPKGSRKPLAPPGAPSPRVAGDGKKGKGRTRRPEKQRIRAAEHWLFLRL